MPFSKYVYASEPASKTSNFIPTMKTQLLLHDFPDLTPHLYGSHANVVVGRNLAISVASKPQMMSFSTHSCTASGLSQLHLDEDEFFM